MGDGVHFRLNLYYSYAMAYIFLTLAIVLETAGTV